MGHLHDFFSKPFTRLGKLDPLGIFSGPKPPTPPPTPPTPPNLGNVLSSQSTQSGPPLGGTFLTAATGLDRKPQTTGGKTLLGQ